MFLKFSTQSALDLEEIGDYIARENPLRAISFLEELEKHCQKITETPEAFPLRKDLAHNLRMAVHGNYLIFFSVELDMLRIERILHGARKIGELL